MIEHRLFIYLSIIFSTAGEHMVSDDFKYNKQSSNQLCYNEFLPDSKISFEVTSEFYHDDNHNSVLCPGGPTDATIKTLPYRYESSA